jgi:chitinase
VLIGAIIVALIALGGIFWMVRSSMSLATKAPTNVAITNFPTSAKVAPGKSVDFVAEVSGAPSSDVTWSVEEGDNAGEVKSRGASAKADTISLYSTYIAPSKPGTYHLVATSTADTKKSASAEITVTGKEDTKGR